MIRYSSPGGKLFDMVSISALTAVGGGERVRAGPLEHAEDHRRLARQIGVRRIIRRAELDPRDVGHAHLAAVGDRCG